MNSEHKYSYQDCWNYAFSLNQNINVEKVKNDIISLCRNSPENFWLNFSHKILTTSDYLTICHDLSKYLKEDYPVPYLTNRTSFYESFFHVEKDIFIPQKDTEILVEKTLEIAEKYWNKKENLKVLDIGTGCGNIVVSLAKNKPNWSFIAVDINEKAIKVAKKNTMSQQIKNIEFIWSNLFDNVNKNEIFDIIVSNPPYISEKEYENLSPFTKRQPKEALIAQNNGYFFYQEIFRQASIFLAKKFLLIMEIGYKQEKEVIKLLIDYFPNAKVSIFLDYKDCSRVVAIY